MRGRLIASERTSSTVTTGSYTSSIVGELERRSNVQIGILATRGDRDALDGRTSGSFRGGQCRLEASPRVITWTEAEEDVWRRL